MRIMRRSIAKFLPGKMEEAMELEQKELAIWSRLGAPPFVTRYRRFLGGGDTLHTVIWQSEWDSLAAMEAAFERAFADPEMQAVMAKFEAIAETHEIELYTPLPLPDSEG